MPTSPLDLVRANNRRRMDIQTQLRQIDEGTIVNADTNEVRSYNDDETAEITKLRSELTEIDARLVAQLELEQRSHEINSGIDSMLGSMLDRQGGDLVDNRSIGERFTSDEYRSWAEQGGRGKFYVDLPGMELRAVTDTTLGVGQQGYGSSASGGVLTRPQRLGRVGQDFLDRRVYLMDELPTISVTQGNIEYVQDKTPLADLANAAREVAESGQKPQGGATFQVVSEAAAVIAEWVNMTRQVVADVPQIQSYLDGRLRYGLKRRADAQIIAGTGTSPNLLGLQNRTGIVTYAPGGAEARYKSIRHAIRLGEDVESIYEMIVMNPADAEIFDLSNDTSAGLHAVNAFTGGIVDGGARSAWGLRQIRSTAIASGTALLIDPTAVAIFDRQQVQAYMTDSHASNFTSNILTLLLEVRLGLGVFNPAGIAKVTFNGTV
jgi:HK97 family phage major capsid protein